MLDQRMETGIPQTILLADHPSQKANGIHWHSTHHTDGVGAAEQSRGAFADSLSSQALLLSPPFNRLQVDSGVADQPMGLEETTLGAKNRANSACERASTALGIVLPARPSAHPLPYSIIPPLVYMNTRAEWWPSNQIASHCSRALPTQSHSAMPCMVGIVYLAGPGWCTGLGTNATPLCPASPHVHIAPRPPPQGWGLRVGCCPWTANSWTSACARSWTRCDLPPAQPIANPTWKPAHGIPMCLRAPHSARAPMCLTPS